MAQLSHNRNILTTVEVVGYTTAPAFFRVFFYLQSHTQSSKLTTSTG